MCKTCGCSDGATATVTNMRTGATSELSDHDHAHRHNHEHSHPHDHGHGHIHDHAHGPIVDLGQAVLARNDAIAARNRAWFAGREILALNLVSSPGAGKTSVLERTIRECGDRHGFFVIEGDQATANDGQRIEAAGAPAIQVNTGTGCHLDADMVARGLRELAPGVGSVVMIENVGNLVCPALFDLGEYAKVAIVSVTEGEDKPLKYPHMFKAAELLIINKTDLLPHLDFDLGVLIDNVAKVNPRATILKMSATSGEGMADWYDWIAASRAAAREAALA